VDQVVFLSTVALSVVPLRNHWLVLLITVLLAILEQKKKDEFVMSKI
jgi:hypothetical protein